MSATRTLYLVTAPEKEAGALLLLKEAAAYAGKSLSWVRLHREFGPLVPAEIDGQQAVTASSLERMLAARAENQRAALRRRAARRSHLRVAVDNTANRPTP